MSFFRRFVLRRHRFLLCLTGMLTCSFLVMNDLVGIPDLGQVIHVRQGVDLLQHIENTLLVILAGIKHILKKSGEHYKEKMDVVEREEVDEFAHKQAH